MTRDELSDECLKEERKNYPGYDIRIDLITDRDGNLRCGGPRGRLTTTRKDLA